MYRGRGDRREHERERKVIAYNSHYIHLNCRFYHKICNGESSVDESSIIDVGSTYQAQPHTHNHAVWKRQRIRQSVGTCHDCLPDILVATE